jgi:hypothetical protein
VIECPTCRISFGPRHRTCPRCGVYKARLEDRIDYLASVAETALEQGAAPAEVESMLREEGLPSPEAAEIVSARLSKVRRVARFYGSWRVLCGVVITPFAAALVLIGAWTCTSPLGRRLLALGLLSSILGIWLLVWGMYGLLTGRN